MIPVKFKLSTPKPNKEPMILNITATTDYSQHVSLIF